MATSPKEIVDKISADFRGGRWFYAIIEIIGIFTSTIIVIGGIHLTLIGIGFIHSAPSNPYSNTQTVYSNIVPNKGDGINLDNSGNLIPAPANAVFKVSGTSCVMASAQLPYSQGIMFALNVTPFFSSHETDGSPARIINFLPPPPSDYYTFTLDKPTQTIKTGGRTFLVTLTDIADLSTKKNGEYYSYTFDINEK